MELQRLFTTVRCYDVKTPLRPSIILSEIPTVVIFILLRLASIILSNKTRRAHANVERIDVEHHINACIWDGVSSKDFFTSSKRGATITKTSGGHDRDLFSDIPLPYVYQRLMFLASVFAVYCFCFSLHTVTWSSFAAFSRVAYTLDDSLTALMTQGGMNCFSSSFDSDLITL